MVATALCSIVESKINSVTVKTPNASCLPISVLCKLSQIPQSSQIAWYSPVYVADLSFSGDIQDPPGQGPVQLAVGDPASAGGLD